MIKSQGRVSHKKILFTNDLFEPLFNGKSKNQRSNIDDSSFKESEKDESSSEKEFFFS